MTLQNLEMVGTTIAAERSPGSAKYWQNMPDTAIYIAAISKGVVPFSSLLFNQNAEEVSNV